MEEWKADNAFHLSESRLRLFDWLSTCVARAISLARKRSENWNRERPESK
jgi:hypothetical protein